MSRKIEEHKIRKIGRQGGGSSYAITLPVDLVRALGWKLRQKVVVSRYGDGLIIRDWEAEK